MDRQSLRKAYGESLVDYGATNPHVAVVVADVSSSVQTSYFAERFPERFFNVGITEQSMVDVAVGLALGGMIPFANTFAVLFLRTFEQIRTCVAYAKTNVKIVGGYSGLSDFKDGPTHHADTDIAIMRSLPNMTVVEVADAVETRKMVPAVAELDGPVYLRITRADMPVLFDESHEVEIGKGVTVRDGDDVTLMGCGVMVSRCLEASKILAGKGTDARVVNMHTIKPLDRSLLEKAANETGAVVTAEDHTVIGGLGGAVAEALSETYPVPLERIGIKDVFTETALTYEELLDYYGMGVKDIVESARHVMKRKFS
ncbi:MAG: transketolase family protein [Candidatus Bathyarchaeota archaeon]|nr:transketolase family protein [Candidatus Bathyarchaeota archaeon]